MSLSGQISVIGSGTASPEEDELAYEVGRELGDRDLVMICGGKGGVMESASRGMSDSDGGITVGILPGADKSEANYYVDVKIPLGIGEARNSGVIMAGDAVIAIGGGFGTLSELAYAQKFGKPIYGINTWTHTRFEFEHDLSVVDAVNRAVDVIG